MGLASLLAKLLFLGFGLAGPSRPDPVGAEWRPMGETAAVLLAEAAPPSSPGPDEPAAGPAPLPAAWTAPPMPAFGKIANPGWRSGWRG